MDIAIRYLHYLGFMLLFASLVAEHLMVAPMLGGKQLRRLAVVDAIYGVAALIVLGTGLAMLTGHGFGKGASYYMKNGLFHAKLTLFVLVVILSVPPTLFFLKHRKAPDEAEVALPGMVKHLQRLSLLLVVALPLLGLLLARGYGAGG